MVVFISSVIAAERKVPNRVRDAPRSRISLGRSNFACILTVFPGYPASRFSRPLRSSWTNPGTRSAPLQTVLLCSLIL